MSSRLNLTLTRWTLVLAGLCLLGFTSLLWSRSVSSADKTQGHVGPSGEPKESTLTRPELIILMREAEVFQDRIGTFADSVVAFYKRGHPAVWIDGDDRHRRSEAWIEVLERAEEEGLDPGDYRPEGLRRGMKEVNQDESVAPEFEVAMTIAAIEYARDVSLGRIDPRAHGIQWYTESPSLEVTALLDALSRSDDTEVRRLARELPPDHEGYIKLRDGLREFRERTRGETWLPIPDGGNLEVGGTAKESLLHGIHRRLEAEGLSVGAGVRGNAPDTATAVFHEDLARALEEFQRRRGIEDDGVLGPITRAELNRSREDRIQSIRMNLERWRWIPGDLGKKHILVNIAAFELKGYEHNRQALDMKVIVGREAWATPVFSDRASVVTFNPEWNVPATIAQDEIVPEMIENASYLEEHNMVLVDRDTEETIDPRDVDWEKAATEGLDYLIRQDSGPANPLGRMKVLFPNQFNVYLHDTPNPELFDRADRALSHGCIRVFDPVALASFLLEGANWSRDRVMKAYRSTERLDVKLENEVPVFILYWTAFVDESGKVQFRPDIYDMDRALTEVLKSE